MWHHAQVYGSLLLLVVCVYVQCVCVCVGGVNQTQGVVLKATTSTSESSPHLWQVLLSVKEA